ncbi:MAG: hypothetical protein RL037_1046 [Bacteroidota bacterium]|jgi:hypothetical protein
MQIRLLIFFFLSCTFLRSQHANFNSQRNWSLHKKELQIGIGATQFNGDLGGSNSVGQDYSLRDLDWPATGLAAWLGYRQRFHPYFATTTSLCLFNLRADDSFSEEATRNARSLNFRSFNIEVQQRIEFIFAANEKFGSTFNLPGNYSKKNRSQQYYVFTGLGLIYFNNQGYYDDPNVAVENHKWINLRPLQTEGNSYMPLTMTVPMGVGFRLGMSRMWRVGMELAYVKTFSDYIDDVSTVYANPSSFSDPIASYMSNPAVGNQTFAPGNQRGDSDQKDAYYHVNLIITKNLTYKDYGRQRKRYNIKGVGRYKV